MDFMKIFEILSDSYKKAILSIVACSLIMYPVLYLAFPSFRNLEWYTQLLISTGISVSYVGVFVSFFINVIKHSDVFILGISLLSCITTSSFLPYVFGYGYSLENLARLMIVCFPFFLFVSFLLSRLLKRDQTPTE